MHVVAAMAQEEYLYPHALQAWVASSAASTIAILDTVTAARENVGEKDMVGAKTWSPK